jgi:hypothetical protein
VTELVPLGDGGDVAQRLLKRSFASSSGFRRRDPFVDRLDPLFDMILVALEDDRGTVECYALWP